MSTKRTVGAQAPIKPAQGQHVTRRGPPPPVKPPTPARVVVDRPPLGQHRDK
jgi:hypothetical protein